MHRNIFPFNEKHPLNKFVRFLILIFFVSLLFFLLKHIGFEKVGRVFISIGLPGIAILIILGFLENGFDALALYFTIPKKIRFLKVFASSSSGSLTNLVFPWDAGEVVKIGLLKKEMSVSEALKSIILWNYILKLSKPSAIMLILIISLITGFDYEQNIFFTIFAISILGFVPYFGMMLLIKLNISVKIVKTLRFFKKNNLEDLMKKAEDMDQSLKTFKKDRSKDYKRVFLTQYFARFVGWASFVICSNLAGFDYSLSILSLAYCAVTLSIYIVSFIPAKIGVSEGTGYLIFSFLGLDGGAGLLITLVLRIKAIIVLSVVSSFNAILK